MHVTCGLCKSSGVSKIFDRLNELIDECQADAILLCETWLNKQTECLVKESSYKLFSIVRRDIMGGGVGILVHKNLRTRLRRDLHVETKTL